MDLSLQLEWLIAAGLVLLLLYEVIAAKNNADAHLTISQLVWKASARSPILPFIFGVLMGHLFWQD